MATTPAPHTRPGLSLVEEEFWYAGPISERKAEQLLHKDKEPGNFLVRDSLLPEADFVLSVNCGSDIWHYDVKVLPNNECIFNSYSFVNLPAAISFYTENRLGSVFLKEPTKPVVSESELPRYIGPKIRLASASVPPRATHMGTTPLPSEDSPGYAAIGPPSTPSNFESTGTTPDPQPGWIVDPTKRDSGTPSRDSSDGPDPNKHPRSTITNHFVLNSGPPTSVPQTISPSDCGIYVHPSDIIDGSENENETTLAVDHTYACPPVNDTTLLDEVKGKGDAEIYETNFDSNISSSTVVAVATISSLQSGAIAQQPKHIRSSEGQLYAVVSKGETARSKHAMTKDTPADREGVQPENRELMGMMPLATSTLRVEGVSRKQPPSQSLLKLPPESVKAEQIAELKQLPSIGKKRTELEKRMKGEEPVGSTSPQNAAPEVPHRVSIPQSTQGMKLVGMPTPPPMNTHPDIIKKEKKQSYKKRVSKSRRSSSSEEDPPMRNLPPPTETPSGEKTKRRLSGSIATPISLMNEGNEMKETFQSVTRRDWNTTLFEVQPGQVPSTFPTTNAVPRTATLTPTLTHTTTTSKDLVSPSEPMRSTLPKVRRTVSPTGHTQLSRRSSRNIHDLVPGVKQASSSQQTSLERRKSEDTTSTAAEVQEGAGQRMVTETIGRVPVGPMNTKRDIKKRKSFLSRKK